ncbi:MAG: hypothetical protein ACOCUL_00480, partial [Bacteroidota bacterium]
IWVRTRKFFFPTLGAMILMGLLIFLGSLFCLIPGIYLGVSLSTMIIVLFNEKKGIGDAFSKSIELNNQKWWTTFGILIVLTVIMMGLAYLLIIPLMAIGLGSMFLSPKIGDDPANSFTTFYYIVMGIIYIIMMIVYAIPYIVIAFQYFSLLEMKEKPSLEEKVKLIV